MILEASPLFETDQCGEVTVRRIDAFGVAIADDTTETVNLAQSGSLEFYLDDACVSPVSSIQISTYSDSASFFIANSSVETVSISAVDSDSVLAAASLDVSFALTKPWGLDDFSYRTRIAIRNSDQSPTFSNIR